MEDNNQAAMQKAGIASRWLVGRAAAQAIALAVGSLVRANRRRQDAKYLSELDDHLLADIGIDRSEIDGFVHWRPTAAHTSTLSENKLRDATHLRVTQEPETLS
ncbi:MAG: DUF1127 domain-containing protein [Mesorhizobium sp.]|uniref:DUF1127 domain-containing protein n=1 Tax=Mesorhizobium sp. TaxID=1871066 RepID=UPI001213F4D5|nr:DUF1127 domain-containing protein [Mesorhizobium sp.]TIQ38034.1 MAG: DUF1127 domain-containing protein [Mesorhizobium sp.]